MLKIMVKSSYCSFGSSVKKRSSMNNESIIKLITSLLDYKIDFTNFSELFNKVKQDDKHLDSRLLDLRDSYEMVVNPDAGKLTQGEFWAECRNTLGQFYQEGKFRKIITRDYR